MFSFQLLIAFADQIDSMKADLTKYFPDIKSSHRVEALARSLGFRTYAALRAVDLFYDGPIRADVNWSAFNDYLEERGFHATAKPLFLAAGRASIRLTLGMKDWDYQNLTHEGFYIDTSRHKGETPQTRAERFRKAREDMLSDSSVEEFLRSYIVVSRIPHTRTVTTKRGAYSLKHIAENASLTFPDGEVSPPKYVCTGSLIFAALSAGFWFKPSIDGSQNVNFNMLQSAIDDLECEIRPDGVAARKRKLIPGLGGFGGASSRKCYEYLFEDFVAVAEERDLGMDFRCLGCNNGIYYYLSYTRKSIIALTPSAHTLKNLTKLGQLEAWNASPVWLEAKTEKKLAQHAASALMLLCATRGIFAPEDRIEGLGRWRAA